MPPHLVSSSDERLIEVLVSASISDVPLAARHDFKWPVAFLEEFHCMSDGTRLADHVAGVLKHLNYFFLC